MRRRSSKFLGWIGLTVAILSAALLIGCSQAQNEAEKPLRIVATTTMAADLARAIAGDHAQVEGLMGPGVDPHLYKATASDISRLARADVVVYNGLHLEGRMNEVLERMVDEDIEVVELARYIPESRLITQANAPDPHIWFDPDLWAHAARGLAQRLAEIDPESAPQYRENLVRVEQMLRELADWARMEISQIPEPQRVLVTSHDAYNYFGRAFDIQVLGVQGLSTVAEAGLADIGAAIDFVRDRGIKAIFVETSVSPAAIERISRDSGARIGGQLFSDAMGIPGQMETRGGFTYDLGTYEGMFRHNVLVIIEGLR